MPLFEYECRSCSYKFEELVSSRQTTVVCPRCQSTDTRKLISTFAAAGGSSGATPSCYQPGCGSSGFG
jgi:putative FmdB family regulatory protein